MNNSCATSKERISWVEAQVANINHNMNILMDEKTNNIGLF